MVSITPMKRAIAITVLVAFGLGPHSARSEEGALDRNAPTALVTIIGRVRAKQELNSDGFRSAVGLITGCPTIVIAATSQTVESIDKSEQELMTRITNESTRNGEEQRKKLQRLKTRGRLSEADREKIEAEIVKSINTVISMVDPTLPNCKATGQLSIMDDGMVLLRGKVEPFFSHDVKLGFVEIEGTLVHYDAPSGTDASVKFAVSNGNQPVLVTGRISAVESLLNDRVVVSGYLKGLSGKLVIIEATYIKKAR